MLVKGIMKLQNTKLMKVAIFHDYVDVIGGAEKLVLTLARELRADIITTDVNKESLKKMGFEDVNIISIGKTIRKPILRQITTSFKFANCDFSDDYDFFIFSGNWAPFAAKKHKPNIFYCHSPVRPFYDLYDSIFHESIFKRFIFVIWVKFQKRFYEHYLNHVQYIVSNSENTKARIKKFLKRNSYVIYPPINCSNYNFQKPENFWISVNRIYPEKRIELQIESFKTLPEEKLVIVGSYSRSDYFSKYANKIKNNLPKNIELLETVSEEKLLELYSSSKGLISTAKDEDFGMVAVEAMASGKPVVCVKEGGFLESVIDNITGILVEPNISDITKAIQIISKNPEKYKEACIEQAKKFDETIFLEAMKKIIHKVSSFKNN